MSISQNEVKTVRMDDGSIAFVVAGGFLTAEGAAAIEAVSTVAAAGGGAAAATGFVAAGLLAGGLLGQALWDYTNPDEARLFAFNTVTTVEVGGDNVFGPDYYVGPYWYWDQNACTDGKPNIYSQLTGDGGPCIPFWIGVPGPVFPTPETYLDSLGEPGEWRTGTYSFEGAVQVGPMYRVQGVMWHYAEPPGSEAPAFLPTRTVTTTVLPLSEVSRASVEPAVEWPVEPAIIPHVRQVTRTITDGGDIIRYDTDPPLPARPRPREKEHKTRSRGMTLQQFLASASEAGDVVDAVFRALPDDVQRRWSRGRAKGPLGGQYESLNDVSWKLEAIWHNWDKLDGGETVANILANEFEDRILGRGFGARQDVVSGRTSRRLIAG